MATKKPAKAVVIPEDYEDLEELAPAVEETPAPKADPTPTTHTIQAGETWASISDQLRPAGTTKHLYAEYLQTLNGGTPTPGRTINL